MQVANKGAYLGFATGPGNSDATRVEDWTDVAPGLQYDELVYNEFGMSVLSYVYQLSPEWVLVRE